MNLEELMKEWEQDSSVDENRLDSESLKTPKLHSKYVNLLVSTKLKATKLRADYNKMRQSKFRYYRGEMGKEELSNNGWSQWQGVKPLKNEMDEFLSGDADLVAIDQRIEYLNVMSLFLEQVLSQLKARDWQIKTSVEWKKFLAGG